MTQPVARSREREQVFAIVRVDADMLEPENQFTVTKVVRSESFAASEAARLNALNASKGARYFVQVTRLVNEVTDGEASTRPKDPSP